MIEQFVTTFTGGISLFGDLSVVTVLVVGMLWGNIAGALPGFNQTLAVGVMVPFTFALGPIEAVAFLVAIGFGVSYGNSIPAILVGIPGTAGAVFTAIEGHALHKKGKSGLALGTSYYGAITGQYVGGLFFILMVVPLSNLVYYFLPPELFALHLLGMTAIISMTGKNVIKGVIAAGIGLVFTLVGPDPISMQARYTFGIGELRFGVALIPVVLGLLAVSELIRNTRQAHDWGALAAKFDAKFPKWAELKRSTLPVSWGSVLGMFVGSIPGVSGSAAAAIAYQQAKFVSKKPEEFGRGSVDGVAANEAAQNAAQAGELVPTLGLGIPGSDTMVLMLSALTIHGIVPGPLLATETPEMLQATFAGLFGTAILITIFGWPIARFLLLMVTLNRAAVLITALAVTVIGVYSLRRSVFDVQVMLICGVVGYVMSRYGYSPAAAAIAVVLGEGLETHLRRGLSMTRNSWSAFLLRPITATLLVISIALFAYGIIRTRQINARVRAEFAEDDGSNIPR